MLQPSAPTTAVTPNRSRLARAFVWLCALVFVLQLCMAFSPHKHDAGDELADCVICQVSSHGVAILPGAPAALLAMFLVVAYLVARRPEYVSIIPLRYLIPSRQAPPVRFSR